MIIFSDDIYYNKSMELKIEKLNLENFMNIIKNKDKNIKEENRTIEVAFYDSIKRKVERKHEDKIIKTEEELNENYEVIRSEIKKLLKRT